MFSAKLFLLLSIFLLIVEAKKKFENKKEWAVIVAGSNGYGNYRHQADACHAYHIVRSHGIPEEHIILMMYDDIANSPMNPYPGKLFNQPNGTDVYEGCKIDYDKKDVTPANFLKVLKGEDMGGKGSGRTVKSGPHDHLFVYFTDHGAPGLIAFPSDMLHAQDLNNALKSMYQDKKFGRLVFYLEACESGSMFEDILPDDINVYAMTAANSHESSWGCYCDNTMHLPCLGDLFSVVWMQDSDVEDLQTETLAEQFKIVKKGTNKSHVMEFGDLSWQNEPVSDYQGETEPSLIRVWKQPITGLVDSRDIPMYQLEKMYKEATSHTQRRELWNQIRHMEEGRKYIDALFDKVLDDLIFDDDDRDWVELNRDGLTQDLRCHKIITEAFHQRCSSLTTHTYGLSHVYKLSNLCRLPDINLATVVTSMIETCQNFESIHRKPKYPVE